MRDECYGFPVFHRVLAQAELLDRVMECVAVDRLAAIRRDGGAAWQAARMRCVTCVHDRECRAWLDAAEFEMARLPPEFCRNRAFLGTVASRASAPV